MSISKSLFEIAQKLNEKGELLPNSELLKMLEAFENCATAIGKSWSGSWLGYHSRVYYSNFTVPPPGAHFSQEWGFMDRMISNDTRGDWKEYSFDDVVKVIYEQAGISDVINQEKDAEELAEFVLFLPVIVPFFQQHPNH